MAEPRRVAFISLSPVRRREADPAGAEREPPRPEPQPYREPARAESAPRADAQHPARDKPLPQREGGRAEPPMALLQREPPRPEPPRLLEKKSMPARLADQPPALCIISPFVIL